VCPFFATFRFSLEFLFCRFLLLFPYRNSYLFSQVIILWRVVLLSRVHFSPKLQVFLSSIFGLLLLAGTTAWLTFYMVVYFFPYRHFVGPTLVPPILCGLLLGLFFRQRAAKIISIIVSMLVSFLYPVFSILVYLNYDGSRYPSVTISCTLIGNILFIGIIRLVNFLFLKYSSPSKQDNEFSRYWYQFKEGKLFFSTWVHFSLLQLILLIYFSVEGGLNALYLVISVVVISLTCAIYSFFYWREARDEFKKPQINEEKSSEF
jgi:hypothetical protein